MILRSHYKFQQHTHPYTAPPCVDVIQVTHSPVTVTATANVTYQGV